MGGEIKEFLNPKRLEMNVHDIKDNVHTFRLRSMTCDELDEMTKIDLAGSDPGTGIRKQLSMMFGENEGFYTKFDTRVLTKVLKYVTEEMTNPDPEK
jgi:hypothetical protein